MWYTVNRNEKKQIICAHNRTHNPQKRKSLWVKNVVKPKALYNFLEN